MSIGQAGHEWNTIKENNNIQWEGLNGKNPRSITYKLLDGTVTFSSFDVDYHDEPQQASREIHDLNTRKEAGEQIIGTYLGKVPDTDLHWISVFSRDNEGVSNTTSNRYNPLAKKRAKELLQSWLTEEEYHELQTCGLHIKSKLFLNRVYVIDKEAIQMIKIYENGEYKRRICVNSIKPGYENDDTVLAKILMIKSSEENFLKTAKEWDFGSITWESMVVQAEGINSSSHCAMKHWGFNGIRLNEDLEHDNDKPRLRSRHGESSNKFGGYDMTYILSGGNTN